MLEVVEALFKAGYFEVNWNKLINKLKGNEGKKCKFLYQVLSPFKKNILIIS